MSILLQGPRDLDSDENVSLRIEFDSVERDMELSKSPSRISAYAGDLAECDAVSTCPSDADSVVLFDRAESQTSFVCGSSVIFRNLRPSVLASDIRVSIESFGIPVSITCPSFRVVDEADPEKVQEFNFGFCTVALSSPDEATLLNFLVQSQGIDETLCRSPPAGVCVDRDRFGSVCDQVSDVDEFDEEQLIEDSEEGLDYFWSNQRVISTATTVPYGSGSMPFPLPLRGCESNDRLYVEPPSPEAAVSSGVVSSAFCCASLVSAIHSRPEVVVSGPASGAGPVDPLLQLKFCD